VFVQVDLSQVDYAANMASIACIAADGFDRVYTVSVNEDTRFAGFIKIYRASLDGSQVHTCSAALGPATLRAPGCRHPHHCRLHLAWDGYLDGIFADSHRKSEPFRQDFCQDPAGHCSGYLRHLQEVLLDHYMDPNQVITRNAKGDINSTQSDGPGAPGGSSVCELLFLGSV
jgi:hypothetical protein